MGIEKEMTYEVEKSAGTIGEALKQETDLKDFINEYKLQSRIIKKEPSTLLYEKLF